MTNSAMEIIDAIKAADSIIVCGHIRPDGDSICAALAMRHICAALGKSVDAVCDSEKPKSFEFLPEYEHFCIMRRKSYDLFIAVDCATYKRLGGYAVQFDSAKNSISIDHHQTNERYCKINYVVPDACSTCEIIYNLFADSGFMDKTLATYIYGGLSTDTGHFMHANTTSDVFHIASELCKYGIDNAAINRNIYCSKSFARMKLTARAIGGIILYERGSIALLVVSLDDLDECGCVSEDTEGLIDFASSINGVKIAMSMCEDKGGFYRISFRSVDVDVAAVAAGFGGGGHKLASGCVIKGNKYDIMNRIVAAAAVALGK